MIDETQGPDDPKKKKPPVKNAFDEDVGFAPPEKNAFDADTKYNAFDADTKYDAETNPANISTAQMLVNEIFAGATAPTGKELIAKPPPAIDQDLISNPNLIKQEQSGSERPISTVPVQIDMAVQAAKLAKERAVRRPVNYKTIQEKGAYQALRDYDYNRQKDILQVVRTAMEGNLEILMDPVKSTEVIRQATAGLPAIVGELGKSSEEIGVARMLKEKVGEEMILAPLGKLVKHLTATPANLLLYQPYMILAHGNTTMSDEEMKQEIAEAAPDIAMVVAGGMAGKALAIAQLEGDALGTLTRRLAYNPAAINAEEKLVTLIGSLPAEDIAAAIKQIPSAIKWQQLGAKVAVEAVTAGVSYGLTMPATAEEKLTNMVQMTAYSIPFILLGHGLFKGFEMVRNKTGIFPTKESIVRKAAQLAYTNTQSNLMMDLGPSKRFDALQHFATGLSQHDIVSRNIDHGIIYGASTELRTQLGEHGYTWFDHGDGTHSALVDKTSLVDPAAYQTYTESIEARTAAAAAEADLKMLADVAASDAETAAMIEKLRAEGRTQEADVLFAKVSRIVRQRDFYRRELNRDPTTNIANRRSFDAGLPAAEANPNTHIIVIDANKFKAVNDTHGHPAGDGVLKALAEHVKGVMQRNGIPLRDVFRIGGDEFATFVTSEDLAVVGKIQEEINAFKHVVEGPDGPPVEVTVSTGSGSSFAVADKAMYEMKHGVPRPVAGKVGIERDANGIFTKEEKDHFAKTGFVPRQKVGYNGRDWWISKVVGETAQIVDAQGNALSVKVKELRILPGKLEVARAAIDINQALATPAGAIPKEPGIRPKLKEKPVAAGPDTRSLAEKFKDIKNVSRETLIQMYKQINDLYNKFGDVATYSNIPAEIQAAIGPHQKLGSLLSEIALERNARDYLAMAPEEQQRALKTFPPEEASKIVERAKEHKKASAKAGFEFQINKPLEQHDIHAKAQPDQPGYSIDPDVAGHKPKSDYGVPIKFESDFDKAVWYVMRTAKEMSNLASDSVRRLQNETRMLQLSKKLGIPLKDLMDHKEKLLREVEKGRVEFDQQLNEIGLEPGQENAQNHIPISVQKFEGGTSQFRGMEWEKVGKTVNAKKFTDLPLTPEERAEIDLANEKRDKYIRTQVHEIARNINDNGMKVHVVGDKVAVVGPDGSVKAMFSTIDEALDFRQQFNGRENNGLSGITNGPDGAPDGTKPPVDVGGADPTGTGGLPPDAGNIQDLGYIDDLFDHEKENIINKTVQLAYRFVPDFLTAKAAWFRDQAAEMKLPDIHISFLGLDEQALKANALTVAYRSQLKSLTKLIKRIAVDRVRYAIGGYMKAGSLNDFATNHPFKRIDQAEPTKIQEFTRGQELAKAVRNATAKGEIHQEVLERAGRILAGKAQLLKKFPDAAAQLSPKFISEMSTLDALMAKSPGLDKVIDVLNDTVKRPRSEMNIFQVMILAEAELNNTLSREDFAKVQGMVPEELNVGNRLLAFIHERGKENGISGDYLSRKVDLVGRHNGGSYAGSIFDMQKGNTAKEAGIVGKLTRDYENVDYENDPFKAAHTVANAGLRHQILVPAIEDFMYRVEKNARDIRAKGTEESILHNNEDLKSGADATADEYVKYATRHADDLMMKINGTDARVNRAANALTNHFVERAIAAENRFRKATGRSSVPLPDKKTDADLRHNVIAPLNRVFEMSAQGAKPAAGFMDAAYITLKLANELPLNRFFRVIKVAADAYDQAGQLQKEGKIAGLQSVVAEDLSTVSSRYFGTRQAFEAVSDLSFSISMQGAVFKYMSAALWVENVGIVGDMFKEHGGTTKESVVKIVTELNMRKLGPSIRAEFARLAMSGQQEAAANIYARAMQHYMIVQYGRANHPRGFGNSIGRVLGTFGTWPTNAVDSFLQTYKYGSWKDIGVYSAKVYLSYQAVDEIQERSGLNLRRYMYNPFDYLTWRGGPLAGAAGSFAQWATGKTTGSQKWTQEGEWAMRHYLPNEDSWNSIVVPWSFQVQNTRESLEELEQGHFLQAALRQMQIRPKK